MPSLLTHNHTFSHKWQLVVIAAFRKYPNPHNTAVQAIDVLSRTLDSRGHLLVSKRLLGTAWNLPSWVIKLVGLNKLIYVTEHSCLDPVNKTYTLRSTNHTFSTIIKIEETLVYSVHPENTDHTSLRHEARVSVFGFPFSDYLEGLMLKQISNMAGKGRKAMECKIDEINQNN